MRFPATLLQLAEKPPPPKNREIFFRLDLSISCNFQQLLFRWQKSPLPPPPSLPPLPHYLPPSHPLPPLPSLPSPPPRNREIFLDWIYPFHAISSNFCSGGRKAPSLPPPSLPPLPHYLPPSPPHPLPPSPPSPPPPSLPLPPLPSP